MRIEIKGNKEKNAEESKTISNDLQARIETGKSLKEELQSLQILNKELEETNKELKLKWQDILLENEERLRAQQQNDSYLKGKDEQIRSLKEAIDLQNIEHQTQLNKSKSELEEFKRRNHELHEKSRKSSVDLNNARKMNDKLSDEINYIRTDLSNSQLQAENIKNLHKISELSEKVLWMETAIKELSDENKMLKVSPNLSISERGIIPSNKPDIPRLQIKYGNVLNFLENKAILTSLA